MKYHRITGRSSYKEYYQPDWAMEACGQHADDFLKNRIRQAEWLYAQNKQAGVIVSPYDAELYGHWWYEGPQFIEFLFKKIHFDQTTIQLAHPLEVIRLLPRIQSVKMKMSSWGEDGYGDVWLNATNDWIYEHIFTLSIEMQELAHKYKDEKDPLIQRVLKQMGRELLLLQSSDWAFIMKTGTMVDYAVRRTNVHTNVFMHLKEMLVNGKISEEELLAIETENNIFPDIQLADFA